MTSTVPPGVGLPSQADMMLSFQPQTVFNTKPSRADVLNEIRRAERPFILYKYDRDWYKMEIGGQDYWFPPDLDGKVIPHKTTGAPVQADGVVIDQQGNRGVRTRYGILRDLRNRNREIGFGPVAGEGHTDIVMVAIENHADHGVVWLPGDETDLRRKAASKALYFKSIRVWAEEQDAARQQFLKNWQNMPGNRGRIPPPPTAVQRRAIDILDEIRTEGRQGREWICPMGCSEWDEFEKYANHMKVSHGKVVLDPRLDTKGAEMVAPGLTNLGEVDEAAAERFDRVAAEEVASPLDRLRTMAPDKKGKAKAR